MPQEIERKFLVTDNRFKEQGEGVFIHQGYLGLNSKNVVRVRVYGEHAFLTIKGRRKGIGRAEYEYEIPVDEATEMLDNLCEVPTLKKYRYRIPVGGKTWEVDEFLGANKGLLLAEIELTHENEAFEKPEWAGKEVSHDNRYYNAFLTHTPYTTWPSE